MVKEQPGAALDETQHRRLGWKSYAFLALVVGIAAGRLRKQLAGRFYGQAGVQQNQSRWFAPSEADLMQERLDELERKERVRRVQEAYYSRQSSFRNLKSARYQKWEEHPREAEEETIKDKSQAERSEAKEKARLRHHYLVLGLDPFREGAFTGEEIKAAFRERALQYHPDKNPDSSDEEMRAKFRELVDSYRAIKMEKNIK